MAESESTEGAPGARGGEVPAAGEVAWFAERLPADKVWFVSLTGEGHWYMGLALGWVADFHCHILDGVVEPVKDPKRPGTVYSGAQRVEPVWLRDGFVAQIIARPDWFTLPDPAPKA